jgi:hypothetical protein
MSELLLFGAPLGLFVATLAYLLYYRASAIRKIDKAYWKALNIPWSLATISSFLLLTVGAYQAEHRQQFDLAKWKVNTSLEMALGFADASEVKWCSAQSSERNAVRSLGSESTLDEFCSALQELQSLAKTQSHSTAYQAVVSRLERLNHPMIPRHEVISITVSTHKLQASLQRLQEISVPWSASSTSRWFTVAIACLFAVAAGVRIATVYAEYRMQTIEDALRAPLDGTAANPQGLARSRPESLTSATQDMRAEAEPLSSQAQPGGGALNHQFDAA